jgi:hypothetical protein
MVGLLGTLAAQPAAGSASASMAVAVAGANQPVGAEFDATIDITGAQTGYSAWQASVSYDLNILAWVPVGEKGWTYTGLGGLANEANASAQDLFPADSDAVNDSTFGGATTGGGVISATGTVATVRLRCIVAGTSILHLVTLAEDSGFGTATIDANASYIETSLTDAQVTCGEGGPVPTLTPVTSPTATPGGPVPTPGGPVATPTPLPPGYEAVDLAAGCNPVASTYPNATPIGTIAAAVGPAGNLNALWEFEGGVWLGYSPAYPQASDLTASDLLDVVFMCVMGPGQFGRPIV